MVEALSWFLLVEFLGWVFFPFTYSFFKESKDKGYSAAKALALLGWGLIFWFGNTIQIISNSSSGAIFSIFILLVISIVCYGRQKNANIRKWMMENLKIILFFDLVFLISFMGWAFVRAGNPEIIGTEKPMELAFINSIYHSPSFPPNDPWLSGYSISYYYFGYLIVALFMQLLGTASGVSFNLAVSLWFSLTAVGSTGLAFNMIINSRNSPEKKEKMLVCMAFSLLAPLFILIISNAEGFLEILHSSGLFWKINQSGQTMSGFWEWLDIQELSQSPFLPFDWIPSRSGGTWWWRASRILQDYTVGGASREIIDEFPFFSFLLADFHPHLISMPFVIILLYTSYYLFMEPREISWNFRESFHYWLSYRGVILALLSGSLIFLNTWDFPIYFGLIVSSLIIPNILKCGWSKKTIFQIVYLAVPFGILSIILYIPFLLGLSSQAGGFLPSLIYKTRAIYYLVMFFPFLLIIPPSLIYMLSSNGLLKKSLSNLITVTSIVLILLSISLAIPLILKITPDIYSGISNLTGLDLGSRIQESLDTLGGFIGIYDAQSATELFNRSFIRIVAFPSLIIFLILLISILFTLLFSGKLEDTAAEISKLVISKTDRFSFLIILAGGVLSLIPEIIYLRDQFGWRMNTIFKFYFQVWILFSIATSYLIYRSVAFFTKTAKSIILVCAAIGMAIGLVYPVFGLIDKTDRFQNLEYSLNGNQYILETNPEEYEAVHFLRRADYGVMVEAIGGSYSSFARISKLTGFPTVLGWPGHELQWRGGANEIGSREADIRELYSTNSWERAEEIINTYTIRYIYLGQLERSTYSVSENKFIDNVPVIFNNKNIIIYEYQNYE